MPSAPAGPTLGTYLTACAEGEIAHVEPRSTKPNQHHPVADRKQFEDRERSTRTCLVGEDCRREEALPREDDEQNAAADGHKCTNKFSQGFTAFSIGQNICLGLYDGLHPASTVAVYPTSGRQDSRFHGTFR